MKIHCKPCGKHVGNIKEGSMLHKDIVFLCRDCEIKRIASDLASKTKTVNPFEDIFRDFGRDR